MEIIFIIASGKVPAYLWECIASISKEIEGVSIAIFIDGKGSTEIFSFSSSIHTIDRRFTNFRKDPLELLDLEKSITAYKNIRIVKEVSDLKESDWIVLENKDFDTAGFSELTKNGFLTFDVSPKKIRHQFFNSASLELDILLKEPMSEQWSVGFTQNLSFEKGIKNNHTKLLFHYSIYLVKLLKQKVSGQYITFSDLKNLKDFNLKSNSIQLSIYYLKLAVIILKRQLSRKKLNWKLAFVHNDKTHFISQPKDSFWADPFVIQSGDDIVVYFEELKSDGLGQISCIILDENFEIKDKKVILNADYHLSFPNVFLKEGRYYMIPETSANSDLQLYQCDEFPFKWSFHSNLMEGVKLVDAVWVFHDNLYWLFANKTEDFEQDNNERLYLYYSESLFTPTWTPHCMNPIITNIGAARNAGAIFTKEGKMYRVAQNCLNGYGKNLVINEIKELSVTNYLEKKIEVILPPKEYVGMHTLNTSNEIQVVDFLLKE